MENFSPIAEISDEEIMKYLPKRKSDSHKGTYGTLKTLCGSFHMPGAGILAIAKESRTRNAAKSPFWSESLFHRSKYIKYSFAPKNRFILKNHLFSVLY